MSAVYVVLVNYNGWRDTIECLETLLRSSYRDTRVIVVDNGSTDGSLDRLREWSEGRLDMPALTDAHAGLLARQRQPVRMAQATRSELEQGSAAVDWTRHQLLLVAGGANLGFAGGNNIAIRYVQSREPDAAVMLLNNDTVISATGVEAMMRLASQQPDAAVGATLLQYHAPARVETLAGARLTSWSGMTWLIATGTERAKAATMNEAMDFISGCCILVPRRVLDRVGPLDERFFLYCEDADWGIRMRNAGVRLLRSADAEVWHKGGATAVHHSPFHDYHNAKSVLLLVRKHYPAALPFAVVNVLVRFVLPKLARGQWTRLRAVWRGAMHFVRDSDGRNRQLQAHAR